MLAHESVGSLPLYEKLFKGALNGGHAFEKEALHSLVTALEIAVTVWIVSHAFGLGEIIDMIGMTLAAKDTVTAVEELITFFKVARSATSEADLEKAGDHFGRAVALVGVGMLVGMFAKFGARGTAEAGEVHGGGAAGEAHGGAAHAVEAPVAHNAAPAPHVEAHHVETPHWKPNVRAVIAGPRGRRALARWLERSSRARVGPSSGRMRA